MSPVCAVLNVGGRWSLQGKVPSTEEPVWNSLKDPSEGTDGLPHGCGPCASGSSPRQSAQEEGYPRHSQRPREVEKEKLAEPPAEGPQLGSGAVSWGGGRRPKFTSRNKDADASKGQK